MFVSEIMDNLKQSGGIKYIVLIKVYGFSEIQSTVFGNKKTQKMQVRRFCPILERIINTHEGVGYFSQNIAQF